VRLPFDALQDDPFLNIRWSVVDLDSGSTLLVDDAPARNRLVFDFVPALLGPQITRFAVGCRVYRPLGPFITDLFNQTVRLEVGPPLAPGAFIRWRYDVKNPQIAVGKQYSYRGDARVHRWSNFHRADKPCKNANHQSRFVYDRLTLDELPFPLTDIFRIRHVLCDYCFFGGPGSTIAAL